jgi:hypothetical protein
MNEELSRELSVTEIYSKTFSLYGKIFSKIVIPFLVAGAITGVLTILVGFAVTIPELPSNPTPEQAMSLLPSLFGAVLLSAVLTGLISWIVYSFTQGIAIKLSSDELQNKPGTLQGSFNFTVGKIVSLLAASIITGILIILGLIALIVPGIIFAIMFSLTFPSIMIENIGAIESLSRSRSLVSGKWLKTFTLMLLFGITIGIVAFISNTISSSLGVASPVLSSILTALILPIFPVGMTIYYYSLIKRTPNLQATQNM